MYNCVLLALTFQFPAHIEQTGSWFTKSLISYIMLRQIQDIFAKGGSKMISRPQGWGRFTIRHSINILQNNKLQVKTALYIP